MGTSQRIDISYGSGSVPGPGAYTKEVKKDTPSFGFGSSLRASKTDPNRYSEPGPGAYEIKNKVGELPSYTSKYE